MLQQDCGVTKALLFLTRSFHPYHPGVRAAWLQWGKDSLNPPPSIPLIMALALPLPPNTMETVETLDHGDFMMEKSITENLSNNEGDADLEGFERFELEGEKSTYRQGSGAPLPSSRPPLRSSVQGKHRNQLSKR